MVRYVDQNLPFVFVQSVKAKCHYRMPFLSRRVHWLDERVKGLKMKETATRLIVNKVPHMVSNGFDGLEVVVVVYTGKGKIRGIGESIVLMIQCQGIGVGAEHRTLHEPGRVLRPPGQLLWIGVRRNRGSRHDKRLRRTQFGQCSN